MESFDNGDNTGRDNTAFGHSTLETNLTGSDNTAVGQNTLFANTTGSNNTAVGATALDSNSTGSNNTAVGSTALTANTGSSNTAVGANVLDANTSGASNTAMGLAAMGTNISGGTNSAFGSGALLTSTGSGNQAFGYYAGAYEVGSDGFYVNNQDRTNTAGDKAKSLMYGVFASTAAAQRLKINANFLVEIQLTSQTIAATNTIAANACGSVKSITSAGAVTTSTTDTFTAPSADATTGNQGCIMTVVNVGANNITL